MRLKSVKILGFKSFADPQILEPSFPGITAVVGPNGCGKSNVVDAIKWVIGESSARQLRGEHMTDVIFNGSSTRKPVGQAHVELIFENSSPSQNSPFSQYAEISIKRIINRDGQSVYFMNNTRCRRRDILDLLSGTGLGARSYAIIEQGMIHRFIEAKPEELKQFLEEAAGISKYYDRKKETLVHLEQTREDLARAADLEKEITARCVILKEQADEAAQYQTLRQSLITARQEYLSLSYRQTHEDFQNQVQRMEKTQAEWSQYQESVAHVQRDCVEKEYQRDLMRETLTQQHREHQALIQSIQEHEQKMGNVKTQLQWIDDRLEQVQSERETKKKLQLEIQEHANQHQDAPWKQKLEEKDWDAWKVDLNQQEERLKSQRNQIEGSLTEIQKQYHSLLRERDIVWTHCEHQRSRITGKKDRLKGLDVEYQAVTKKIQEIDTQSPLAVFAMKESELAENQTTISQYLQNVEALRAQHLEKSTVVAQIQQKRQDLLKNRQRLEVEFQALSEKKSQWIELVDKNARMAMLQSFQDCSYEQYALAASATQFLFQGQSVPTAQMLERESDLDVEYIWGSESPSYWSSFIPSDHAQQALDRRATLEPHQAFVLPSGVLIGPNWTRPLRKRAPRISEIHSQLQNLQIEINQIEIELQHHQKELSELISRKQKCEELLRESQKNQERIRSEMHQAELALQKTQQLMTHFKEHQTRLDAEKLTHEKQLVEMEQQYDALAKQHSELSLESDRVQELRLQKEHDFQQFTTQYDEWKIQRDLQWQEYQNLLHQAQVAALEKQHQEQRSAELENDIQISLKTQTSLLSQKEEKQKELELLASLKEGLIPSREEAQIKMTTLNQQVQLLTQEAQKALEMLREVEKKSQEYLSALYACETDRNQRQALLDHLKEQIEEQGWLVEQICLIQTSQNLTALKNQWTSLDKKMREFGPVNLKALSEYQTESARAQLLSSQREDLEKAIHSLENAMHLLESEIQTLFAETFEKLKKEFEVTFPLLFQGGSATLTLEVDPLTGKSGMVVHAQPPGKKNTRLSVLSGGEKALTAAALVFSFFQLNPAPFCILDEIDAPLDDPNTFRLGTMLESLKERVQFIVVTHSKVMMEVADRLYGVTMKEPGVSRFVSVERKDLENAVEPVPEKTQMISTH